ncbi:MAG: hydantoinase/oxoprolinase family protein [Euryarchaeota archaeon]|jgi:probable H4MPT-linked C1 transfer pathway protein|nr:hydantoinase/oxoprolinase family protein [Euryarchaeota archaeon]HNS25189.1 hydantoinase/oxoprolinase family protein [Methanobacteriaceae archaeon]
MKIAGLDIGGATTDLAVVEFSASADIKNVRVDNEYLPIWMEKENLGNVIKNMLGSDFHDLDAIGVSMTAELADAYATKKEGVLDIVKRIRELTSIPMGFVGQNGIMGHHEVLEKPLDVAAANWIATVPLAAMISPDCILIDTGSTTTDIIPIRDGQECAQGRSDLERLATGELVYTGLLRTNVATLVDRMPLRDIWVRVASELFAITADIHIILGNIEEREYSCPTPDGSGESRTECMQRMARVVCSDLDVLAEEEVEGLASYVYQKQLERITEALLEVAESNDLEEVVVTGLGMDLVGREAANLLGLKVTGMNELLTREECISAPAVGTALLMEEFLRSKSFNENI